MYKGINASYIITRQGIYASFMWSYTSTQIFLLHQIYFLFSDFFLFRSLILAIIDSIKVDELYMESCEGTSSSSFCDFTAMVLARSLSLTFSFPLSLSSPAWCSPGGRRRRSRSGSSTGARWTPRWSGSSTPCQWSTCPFLLRAASN